MDDLQLDRNLRSIGKECFVTFFGMFCDGSRSSGEAAAQIKAERDYTWKSCRSRTSKARSIIEAGRAADALDMVSLSTSPKVPAEIKERASKLAAGLRESSRG